MRPTRLEVGADARTQVDRLAHVEHGALSVKHLIDAGFGRDPTELLLKRWKRRLYTHFEDFLRATLGRPFYIWVLRRSARIWSTIQPMIATTTRPSRMNDAGRA